MPGMRCTVAVCNNSRLKAKKSSKDIRFYHFPKDNNLRKIWVQKCQRGGKWNPENCRVCSEHFTKDDFVRDLQAELLNLPEKRKLKEGAVPSRNLVQRLVREPPPVAISKDKRSERLAKRSNKLLVKDILKADFNEHPDLCQSVSLVALPPSPSQIQGHILNNLHKSLLAENEVIKKQLINMKEENDNFKLL